MKNADLKDAHYTVEQDPRAELFAMIDDLLVVQSKLRPGSYRITIKAQAIPMGSDSLQQKTMSVESHSLRMGEFEWTVEKQKRQLSVIFWIFVCLIWLAFYNFFQMNQCWLIKQILI